MSLSSLRRQSHSLSRAVPTKAAMLDTHLHSNNDIDHKSAFCLVEPQHYGFYLEKQDMEFLWTRDPNFEVMRLTRLLSSETQHITKQPPSGECRLWLKSLSIFWPFPPVSKVAAFLDRSS